MTDKILCLKIEKLLVIYKFDPNHFLIIRNECVSTIILKPRPIIPNRL